MIRDDFKSGFVTLIGRPMWEIDIDEPADRQKIAITSNKPQTTRNRIQTVLTTEEGRLYSWTRREFIRRKISWENIW